ncbi:hypothetical protein Tco_0471260 [Tanacetum coccineum]
MLAWMSGLGYSALGLIVIVRHPTVEVSDGTSLTISDSRKRAVPFMTSHALPGQVWPGFLSEAPSDEGFNKYKKPMSDASRATSDVVSDDYAQCEGKACHECCI